MTKNINETQTFSMYLETNWDLRKRMLSGNEDIYETIISEFVSRFIKGFIQLFMLKVSKQMILMADSQLEKI